MNKFEKKPSALTAETNKEKVPDNVVILERPEARYRIVYEKHVGQRSPEEIGRPNALVVEYVSQSGYAKKWLAESLIESFWEQKREESGGKQDEEKYLKKNQTPLYFIDIIDPERILDKEMLNVTALKTLETSLAGGFIGFGLIEARRQIKTKQGMSRRQFLKLSGSALGTLYFGPMLLDLLLKLADLGEKTVKESSEIRRVQRTIGKIQEKLHPETEGIILTFRNALWAQKLETIAKELTKQGAQRPEVGIGVGGDHFGIEDMLNSPPQKRLEAISKFLKVFGSEQALPNISPIARLEYSEKEKRWIATQIINDPELEKLEKELKNKNL